MRQSVAAVLTPVRTAVWSEVPSTYVLCAQDRGTPPELQRELARRAGRALELDAGHHVMLSRPADLSAVVLQAASDGSRPGPR